MKKILVPTALLLGLLTYLYDHELVEFVKAQLRDEVIIRCAGDMNVGNIILEVERDKLFSHPVISGVTRIPRAYGKLVFYVSRNGDMHYLDASFIRQNLWSKSVLELEFKTVNDSIALFWSHHYDGTEQNGIQRFKMD